MWDTRDATWATHLDALRAFIVREGHALVPAGHVEQGQTGPVKLGSWVVATRARAKPGSTDKLGF